MNNKNKFKICKERNYHNWCGPKDGNTANSIGETYEDMDVVFRCEDCGAEAEGTVYWENIDEDD
jgi:hypothetical protein